MTAATYRRPARPARPAAPGGSPLDLRVARVLTRLLVVAALALAAAAVTAWVMRQPGFTLQSIEVEGELVRSSVAQIRAAALPRLAGNFFTLDLAAARTAFEAAPWIRSARTERVWPNRLRVQVEEHRPAALWASDDGARIVNTHGEVFEANLGAIEDEALPTLAGPPDSSARALELLRALRPVLAPLQHEVDTLALSSRGSWTVTLDNGVTIELGRGETADVVERTRRFVATLPELVARFGRPPAHADLRHRDGYALRLTGLVTDAADAGADKPRAAAAARAPR